MKSKVIRQGDLTSECWMIQMWGISACEDCEYLDTDDCGGKEIRKALLEKGHRGKVALDGLPNAN